MARTDGLRGKNLPKPKNKIVEAVKQGNRNKAIARAQVQMENRNRNARGLHSQMDWTGVNTRDRRDAVARARRNRPK